MSEMETSHKVLFVGKLDGENVNIKASLLETKKFDVELVSDTKKAIQMTQDQTFGLGIFSIQSMSESFLNILESLRTMGCQFPILVIVKTVRVDDFANLGAIKSVNVLQHPFKEKDLVWHAETMVEGKIVQQRAHPRFYVNYDGNIEIPSENLFMKVQMHNYSLGGACITVNGGPDLKPGDKLFLSLDLKGTENERTYASEVVWSNLESVPIRKRLIGLKFVQKVD